VLKRISHLTGGAAVIVAFAAGLALGCGAGHPKALTLQAKMRQDAPFLTNGTAKASCRSRSCTLSWHDRVHSVHESWLIARTTIASLDDPYYRPMQRFVLRIRDRHTKRLWSFACHQEYSNRSDAHWPYDRCVQTVRPLT
jgi:hypothetical protein